jgi:hypothetical protein
VPTEPVGAQSLTIYRTSGDIVLNREQNLEFGSSETDVVDTGPNAPILSSARQSGKTIFGILGLISLSICLLFPSLLLLLDLTLFPSSGIYNCVDWPGNTRPPEGPRCLPSDRFRDSTIKPKCVNPQPTSPCRGPSLGTCSVASVWRLLSV